MPHSFAKNIIKIFIRFERKKLDAITLKDDVIQAFGIPDSVRESIHNLEWMFLLNEVSY